MYFYLVSSLKRRLITELKESFAQHPIYEKIVPFIQNKFSFDERPQYGIVVKGSNANKVQLAGDNFLGVVSSHVMLAYIGQRQAYPLEWIREDLNKVLAAGDVFPTRPGIYFMEILSAPEQAQDPGYFVIDPQYTVTDEPVLRFISGIEHEAHLQDVPLRGTLRLYENNRILLTEGPDYTVNWETGELTILLKMNPGATLTADYRTVGPSTESTPFFWNTSDVKTLPGVVLAFGKRARKGDKVAIVVYKDRVDAAFSYGGKTELSFELDIISRDSNQMEEIVDHAYMTFLVRKPVLEYEGIEITEQSIGGETEETYDETADESFYNASFSITLRADWEIHVPLPLTISKVTPSAADGTSTLVGSVPSSLFFATVPTLPGRNNNYERII